MISSIIIDLDGPILDGKLRHYHCYNEILREFGYAGLSIDEYWDLKRNRIDRRAQLAASNAEDIYDQFLTAWKKRIEERNYLVFDQLQPGARERIETWKGLGIKIILTTLRNNRENLVWQLDSLNLMTYFTHIVALGTDAGANEKGDAILEFLGSNKNDSLWIGDTEVDIAASKHLGCRVCAVSCGLRTPEYLATLNPDFLVADMSAIKIDQIGNVWKQQNVN
jgi:phosphoglycolate phosphatase